jgi:hypothetical protein
VVFYVTEKVMDGSVALVLLLGNITLILGLLFYKFLSFKKNMLPKDFDSLPLLNIIPEYIFVTPFIGFVMFFLIFFIGSRLTKNKKI